MTDRRKFLKRAALGTVTAGLAGSSVAAGVRGPDAGHRRHLLPEAG